MSASRVGRIAIVGAGQVGTMLGGALVAGAPENAVEEVALFDIDDATARASLDRGAGHRLLRSLRDVLTFDAVVLAVPMSEIVRLVDDLGARLAPGTLLLDTGGAKGVVVQAMRRSTPGIHAVGGHPMAGTERPGPSAARPELLRGAVFVLTPAREDPSGLARAEALARAAGAVPAVLDPMAHDRVVARTSHLPHLVAFALAQVVAGQAAADQEAVAALIGGGYHGATRLAAGDPRMIGEFLSANAGELRGALDELRSALDELAAALAGDPSGLVRLLAEGRAARDAAAPPGAR